MDKIKMIKDKMAEVYRKIELKEQSIEAEKRSKTKEERTELDSWMKDLEGLEEELQHEERLFQLQSKVKANPTSGNPNGQAGAVNDPAKDQGWRNLGEFLVAVHRAAIDPHRVDRRLLESRAILGQSESVPADGGFLVQTDFVTELLKQVYETGLLIPKVKKVPISGTANATKINAIDESSRATGSRLGAARCYWVAEGGDITSSKIKIRQIGLSLHKLAGLVYVTDENLADAPQLESIVSDGFRGEFQWMIDDAIKNGLGGGQPLGFMNSPCLVTVAKTASQTATTITALNIMNMYSRWLGNKADGIWLVNRDTLPQLWQLSVAVGTAGGSLVWMPAGGMSNSPYDMLGGIPVMEFEQCETLGTVGDICLIDPTQYVLGDKGTMQAASSIHVAFATDQTAFRFIMRLDGTPIPNLPITPAKGTNTRSPFVVLATRG